MKFYTLLITTLIFVNVSSAQIYRMNATNNGQTINLACPTSGVRFADSGSGSSHYANGRDDTLTFSVPNGKLIKFDFGCGSNLTNERIDPTDTLFIYDGSSENPTLLYAVTGNPSNSDKLPYFDEGSSFSFLSPSSCITFRFKTDGSNNNDGWDACVTCVDSISCGLNESASDLFGAAPFICNTEGYCGNTSSDFGEDYPVNLNPNGGNCPSGLNFLGTIENNSWLKFIADSTTVVFDFNVSTGGSCLNGIQTAIFSYDGTSLTRMSNCSLSDGSHSGNFQLKGNGLVVGETYYIMTDGNAGDNCDFTINVNAGVNILDAGPDQVVCAGDPLSLSASGPSGASYVWNSTDGVVVNALGANQSFNPLVPTTYIVEISGGGICEKQTDTLQVTICVLLPVEILGFSAECTANFVQLNWQTASEVNNEYFVIEKSTDGVSFVSVGRVSGAGNSNAILSYSFQDFDQADGVTYYRLRQIDFNGEISYSNIISTNKCNDIAWVINKVMYNSSNEIVLNYKTNKTENIHLILMDMQGKLVMQKELTIYQQDDKVSVKITKPLKKSIYMLRLVAGRKVDTKKIILSNY